MLKKISMLNEVTFTQINTVKDKYMPYKVGNFINGRVRFISKGIRMTRNNITCMMFVKAFLPQYILEFIPLNILQTNSNLYKEYMIPIWASPTHIRRVFMTLIYTLSILIVTDLSLPISWTMRFKFGMASSSDELRVIPLFAELFSLVTLMFTFAILC